MRVRFWAAFAVGVVSFASAASAQVSWNGYDWNVDRYDTEKFEPIGPQFGRPDVLHILLGDAGFDNLPPRFGTGFQAGFYNTQGRKALVNLPGSSFATGDLYIPGSWAAQQATSWQSANLWGEVAKAPNPNNFVG
jgi:hypothetical protein